MVKTLKFCCILLLICTSSCTSLKTVPGFYPETSELEDIIDLYRVLKLVHRGTYKTQYPIVVKFIRGSYPRVAKCYRENNHTQREVLLNTSHWNRLNKSSKLELIMHELGHCDLNYEHQDKVVGIMNSKKRITVLTNKLVFDFFNKGL